MTDKDFLNCLKTILDRKNSYNNKYPYNVGYYHGEDKGGISFDCWNLVKAICWSNGAIAKNYRVGNYAVYVPNSGLGDWTGRQILDHCSDVSGNMANIVPGEFLLYEGDAHAGVYWGDGKVIECTVGWGQNGVIMSDIDSAGRSYYKGVQRGRWYRHGKLPFVSYSEPYPKFNVGDSIMIVYGAKVYGMDIYFADFVYDMVLTVKRQDGDKVVAYKGADWYIGDVSAKDVIPYVEPEPEPEPTPEPEPEPEPEPTPEPEPEPTPDPEPSFWDKVLATCEAIIEFLRRIFGDVD